MSALDLRCEQCGHALALADERCASCGLEVPLERRQARMVARAESLAEAENFREAARALEAPLKTAPPEQAKLLWRKRGGWLRRAGDPALLDQAEAALAESLRLDDNDDMSHQVWMDLLQSRGLLDKARGWYHQRLQANPEDQMAKRQMAILRLSADFKTATPPKLAIPESGKPGLFSRLLKPSKGKLATAWITAITSGIQAGYAFSPGGHALDNVPELGAIGPMLNDPWTPTLITVLAVAYLVWAAKGQHD